MGRKWGVSDGLRAIDSTRGMAALVVALGLLDFVFDDSVDSPDMRTGAAS